ncbi:hypothetical protein Mapa_003335 [Marchantia paleacea]|nr:hypothetical protein Mapa_003335 [Marchantia paleacea]
MLIGFQSWQPNRALFGVTGRRTALLRKWTTNIIDSHMDHSWDNDRFRPLLILKPSTECALLLPTLST